MACFASESPYLCGEKRFPEIGREAAMAAVQRHRVRLSGNRVRVPDSPAAVSSPQRHRFVYPRSLACVKHAGKAVNDAGTSQKTCRICYHQPSHPARTGRQMRHLHVGHLSGHKADTRYIIMTCGGIADGDASDGESSFIHCTIRCDDTMMWYRTCFFYCHYPSEILV